MMDWGLSSASSPGASAVVTESLSNVVPAKRIGRFTRSILYCLFLLALSLCFLSWGLPPLQSRPERLYVPLPGIQRSYYSRCKSKIVADKKMVALDSSEPLATVKARTRAYNSQKDALQALCLREVHIVDEEGNGNNEEAEDVEIGDSLQTLAMFGTIDAVGESSHFSAVRDALIERGVIHGEASAAAHQLLDDSLHEYRYQSQGDSSLATPPQSDESTEETENVQGTDDATEITDTEDPHTVKKTRDKEMHAAESDSNTVPLQRQPALDECESLRTWLYFPVPTQLELTIAKL